MIAIGRMIGWFVVLALVTSCRGVTSAPPSSYASPTTPQETVIGTPAVETLRDARLVARDWLTISDVSVSSRWIAWTGIEQGDATRDAAQLVLVDRQTDEARVVARAPSPAGLMVWLRINDEWAVWVEYTDRATISDWRVRTMHLPEGKPATILAAPAGAGIGDRPEFALSGDQVVVSARPEGARAMQLLGISLATGEKRVLLEARAGQAFGWPAFEGDVAVVESHRGGRDELVHFSSVAAGTSTVIQSQHPMSEPTLAGHWLGYKAATRGSDGKFIVRDLRSGAEHVVADSVESPVGRGSRFVWTAGGGRQIYMADEATGRRFVFSVKDASRGFYAQDAATLLFTTKVFEGERRDRVNLIDLPR